MLICAIASLQSTCSKPTEPVLAPPYLRTIELSIEDSSCTEAWLRITLAEVLPPQNIVLKRNDETISHFALHGSDSILVDIGLLPNRSYDYKAYRVVDAVITDSSSDVTMTTLDTTNQDFVFRGTAWSISNNFTNEFNDVAIINDTLAYACGRIYLYSGGSVDSNLYNVARWNGTDWELMRIPSYVNCGQDSLAPFHASSVIAFGPDDVWIAIRRGQVVRWNGTSQTAIMCLPQPFTINRIWGQNPRSVYAVGDNGRIAHYADGDWRIVESGTTNALYDVYGARHPQTGEHEILCIASSPSNQSKILKIHEHGVSEVQIVGLPATIYRLWHIPGRRYIVSAWNRAYSSTRLESGWTPLNNMLGGYSVAGSALNEIIVEYSPTTIWHFNGFAWRSLNSPTWGDTWFNRVSVKGNTIIGVGHGFWGAPMNRAVASVGRR